MMLNLLPSVQCELLERFPEEAGVNDPAHRMIPFLPGACVCPCVRPCVHACVCVHVCGM